MEKDCQWHFKEEGGRDIGPNDPIDEKFKGQPYYSIVREALQNSLDAVDDENLPVTVSFSSFELNRLEFPNLFKIENNIRQCQAFYPNDANAKRLFDGMINYLQGNEPSKKKLTISCLKISDYNTRGMSYDSEKTDSPFYAFLRAGGVSAKSSGSGGSFGFGKGAYYTLSPIKSIIVSTKDKSNNVFFEGSTILTTHKDNHGKKLTASGYYDNNDGEPIQNEENIPDIFKRTVTGTDVNIIGLWPQDDRQRLMIKSVLNNFWLAIFSSKLIVKIEDIIIDKNSLESIIDDYFPNEFESGNALEIELWNPKPYFKAVKYSDTTSDQYKMFSETLELLGDVKLYIYLEKALPNRVSYFRKPKMVVCKKTNRKITGYVAVFICENKQGNEILRLMENPAHNEWRKENYPKDAGQIDRKAKKAEAELNNFINEKLDTLSKINTSKKVAFLGLEDYLSIPEDLLDKDDDADLEGANTSNVSGNVTHELTENETGLQTTNNQQPIKIKPSVNFQSDIKEVSNAELDILEEAPITTGGRSNEGTGGTSAGNEDGENQVEGNNSGETNSKVLIKVKLTVAAQEEYGIIYHYLIITSADSIKDAELELFVSGDNDREDGLKIINSDNGNVYANSLKNVSLSSGKNQVKIRFADNLKHSIKIKAYAIQ